MHIGAFTRTETDTQTLTDTMATVPNGIGVAGQHEDLRTIPFLSVSDSVSVNAPLKKKY